MLQSYQILLFFVIIALTVILIAVGWQIFQILSEIRKMLSKSNLIVDHAISATSSISKSIQNINGFSSGVKAVFNLFSFLKK